MNALVGAIIISVVSGLFNLLLSVTVNNLNSTMKNLVHEIQEMKTKLAVHEYRFKQMDQVPD